MAKKSVKKIAAKGAEQYMLRLPPGLRDSVARRAAENGRSMNTEIIEAIEKHLRDADRVTQLWEVFGKHRENIEALDSIRSTVEWLDLVLGRRQPRNAAEREARGAGIPPEAAEVVGALRRAVSSEGIGMLSDMGVRPTPQAADTPEGQPSSRKGHRGD
jgi:hypothetical protein